MMLVDQLIDKIELNDLASHQDLSMIAEIVGIEKTRELIKIYGGLKFMIPQVETLMTRYPEIECKLHDIIAGKIATLNPKNLALELHISERVAKRIINTVKLKQSTN